MQICRQSGLKISHWTKQNNSITQDPDQQGQEKRLVECAIKRLLATVICKSIKPLLKIKILIISSS